MYIKIQASFLPIALIALSLVQTVISCDKPSCKSKSCSKGKAGGKGCGGTAKSGNPSSPLSTKNPLKLPIDTTTCSADDGKLSQLNQVIKEADKLLGLGLNKLLSHHSSPLVQRYFGNVTQVPMEADLSAPIGVLSRLKRGAKNGIVIQCDGNEQICKADKISKQGGYVITDKLQKNSPIVINLCSDTFFAQNGQPAPRLSLTHVCQDDWTMSSNKPTVFGATALLSLLMQIPQLSSAALTEDTRSYADVVDLASASPQQAAHNEYTYLYFLLDAFARTNVSKAGCPGCMAASRANHETW